MIALLQRVSQAWVEVEERRIAGIGAGLLLLLGVERGDSRREADRLLERVLNYRVFPDQEGRMNVSLADSRGGLLIVPQFTLAADTRKGRRPSFTRAAAPDKAEPLVSQFAAYMRQLGVTKVATGLFGASMLVYIENDGPVTIVLDTDDL